MSAKKRSDSVLDKLPPHQQTALEQWLCEENVSYKDAAARLHQDFNVKVAPSSLVPFFQSCQQRRMLDRIAASSTKANLVVAKLKANPAQTYEALMGAVGQLAFEAALSDQKLDVETLTHLANLAISGRTLTLKEQELSLKRSKYQRDTCELFLKWFDDQQLKAIASAPSSNAEKIELLGKKLFAEDWEGIKS
ncbi:MAG: hypothetical protein JWR69_90 [Pedosphaera sp.]|nr:hypothetical protein [Pedosphaera sp.]